MSESEPAWLADDQRTAIENRWGSGWSEPFATYLRRRADIEQLSADNRATWLSELLTDRSLNWVTPQQSARLELLTSPGPWRDWLPNELDAEVPGWTRKGPEELADWLDKALPVLERDAAARGLGWVPDTWHPRLDALTPARGPWRTWLLTELDQQWPGWEGATVEQRTDWLYGWLPHFEGRPQQEEEDPRTFGWATGDFATRIARLPDTQREGLLKALDENWVGWERAPVADRLTFLTGWLPHFESPAAATTAPPLSTPSTPDTTAITDTVATPASPYDLPLAVVADDSMNDEQIPELDELFDKVVRPVFAANPEYAGLSAAEKEEAVREALLQHMANR
ncbi:hypothetical protein [Actinophytocola glycyrrhizae]|uniref:Uncharacterized protein n=1 Tax=Actinophytocola glycyrrhizae TaxID=2044873 RepID=A0ABV9SCH2_9PSEU